MLRAARPITSAATLRRVAIHNNRSMSTSSKSILEGDTGHFATHIYHKLTTVLVVAAPIYFMVPDSMTDGPVNQAFGVALAANISAHSWVGLNYVATDYVPKISKKLLGPARIVNAGMAAITLLGLSKIALSPGGIKGTIKGLWNPKIEEEKSE